MGNYVFKDILDHKVEELDQINPGDVVALIGDFDPKTIFLLIKLMELNAIVVPLTSETKDQHEYFFKAANVEYIFEYDTFKKVNQHKEKNKLILKLKSNGHGGLVLFSSGTTSKPKAVLHNLHSF